LSNEQENEDQHKAQDKTEIGQDEILFWCTDLQLHELSSLVEIKVRVNSASKKKIIIWPATERPKEIETRPALDGSSHNEDRRPGNRKRSRSRAEKIDRRMAQRARKTEIWSCEINSRPTGTRAVNRKPR
jgi:hypothetical protein